MQLSPFAFETQTATDPAPEESTSDQDAALTARFPGSPGNPTRLDTSLTEAFSGRSGIIRWGINE